MLKQTERTEIENCDGHAVVRKRVTEEWSLTRHRTSDDDDGRIEHLLQEMR